MSFTDEYGAWKQVGELLLTQSSGFIAVPATSNKTIRFTYLVDWNEWDNNIFKRSKCIYRWHYGSNRELHGFYSTLYAKKTKNIVTFNLLSAGSNLFPRELEARIIPLSYRRYFSNVGLLDWTLKIEELQYD